MNTSKAFKIVSEYPFTKPLCIEGDTVSFVVQTDAVFDVPVVEDQLSNQGLDFTHNSEFHLDTESQNYYEASITGTSK